MFNSLNYNEAQRRFRRKLYVSPCLSFPLYFPFWVFTLIYSVQCCFKRPLCPGVGIIMGLPQRLIEPEPAITSVLLEYACKHWQTQAQPPPALILLLASKYKAPVSSCLSNTVRAQQSHTKCLVWTHNCAGRDILMLLSCTLCRWCILSLYLRG